MCGTHARLHVLRGARGHRPHMHMHMHTHTHMHMHMHTRMSMGTFTRALGGGAHGGALGGAHGELCMPGRSLPVSLHRG